MNKIAFYLTLLLCSLWPALLNAQEGPARVCRVLFLGGADKDPETAQLFDGSTARAVDLPRLNLSQSYKFPSGDLTLRLLPATVNDFKAIPPAAPSVSVPAAVNRFYLLVTQDPANKTLPLRMQLIDASVDRFKTGQMLWFNLTAHDVSGQLGSRKLELKARSRVVLDAPASGAEEYPVNLSYRIAGKDGLYPLCETRWTYDPVARTVFFVLNEPGSRAPRVLGFPDRPGPVEAPEH